jgi:hypothetical protein
MSQCTSSTTVIKKKKERKKRKASGSTFAGKGAKKLEHSHIADEIVKRDSHSGKCR